MTNQTMTSAPEQPTSAPSGTVKPALYGKTLRELSAITQELGLPGYAARQISEWLYKKHIRNIGEMTNLSLAHRGLLESHYQTGLTPPLSESVSVDGTRKYLFPVSGRESRFVETASIPDRDRVTLCVSSQVGCKMGCAFCMTGRQGFQGNLTSTDILNQWRSLPVFSEVTNIVFMGMGEPLDNLAEVMKSLEILTAPWGYAWSPKRVTLSTIGIWPALKTFLEQSGCHLAISLHSPFEEERLRLMPAQKAHPIHRIIEELRHTELGPQRRISFEYIMLRGINDSPRHVRELARLLHGLRCRINLIRFHPLPDSPFESSGEQTIASFQQDLEQKGIITTIRQSRGMDIQAACGLLSTRAQNTKAHE